MNPSLSPRNFTDAPSTLIKLEEFENGGLTAPDNASNVYRPHHAIITGHLGFVFEKKLGQGNHLIIVKSTAKSSVFKVFSGPH